MKKIIKKYNGELISFTFTIIFLLLVFKMVGILDNSILISDLKSQYYPFLSYFRDFLKGKVGLFSLSFGLGDNFIGTLYYYLLSPFNLLLFFISNINLFVIIIVILKSAFSAFFCYRFLKYQFDIENKYCFVIFSVLYSMSSYFLAYNFHIQFLDIYMLFPLLLLGIDKIIKESKYFLYIFVFILCIFCNYYFSYMIAIFSFIYFNYLLFVNNTSLKSIIKLNKEFIIISFFTCLTMSFIFLPIVSEIETYSRESSLFFGGEKLNIIINFKQIILHYLLGDFSKIFLLNHTDFYLYTSIICIPLLFFYFINDKFSLREKISTGSMFLILLLSISINYVNYIWHGFLSPSCFNGRYTFMFILFIILICTKSLYYIKEFCLKYYFICFWVLLFPLIIFTLAIFPTSISLSYVFKMFLLLFLLLILKNISKKVYLKIIMISLLVFELLYNSSTNLLRYNYYSIDDSNYVIFSKIINYIKENDTSSFYRIDNNLDFDNLSVLYGYNGIDYFNSTIKKNYINFFVNTNAYNHFYTKNSVVYDSSYKLLSSLLGVKYYYMDSNIPSSDLAIKKIDDYTIYKNNDSLSLGYMVNSNLSSLKYDDNGLQFVNDIYKTMSNSNDDILDKIDVSNADNSFSFNNTDSRDFYLLVDFTEDNFPYYFDVYLNGEKLENSGNMFIFKIKNEYELDNLINIDVKLDMSSLNFSYDLKTIEKNKPKVYAYYFNEDIYNDDISFLMDQQLNVTKINRDGFEGNINVLDDNMLFLTCVYSDDLDVYVDNVKVEKEKVLDSFIGIDLKKGKHNIVVKYRPKMLYISFIPSFIGLCLLILYLRRLKKEIY